jgi:hypothetical protein
VACGACHRARIRADPVAFADPTGLMALRAFETVKDITSLSRGADSVRVLQTDHPRYQRVQGYPKRGAGNAGCALHPAVSCAKLCEETHTSRQVQRKHSGIPRAMALRLMPRSPRRRIRLVTVVSGSMACLSPVGPACLRGLGASNGRQDHTVLPYATPSSPRGFAGFGTLPAKFWRRQKQRRSSCALLFTHGSPPCEQTARPTLPRPPHLIPRS